MTELSISQFPDEDATVIEGIKFSNTMFRIFSQDGFGRGPFLIDSRADGVVILRTIVRWPERVMIFGMHETVKRYIVEHKLSFGFWQHGSSPERITGLDPSHFNTVVLKPLDPQATEALELWRAKAQGRACPTCGRDKVGPTTCSNPWHTLQMPGLRPE